jgi:nitrite reductase/ring-hydroxylating ferredoxin subunit
MEQKDITDTVGQIRLCEVDMIEEDEGLRVEVEGHEPFAVFRVGGKYFVTDDTCSHGQASLSEGTVEDGYVECPWHSGRFCLKTGEALTFPAVTPIRVYPAIVSDGAIFIYPNKGMS